jgi:hypothetical protein
MTIPLSNDLRRLVRHNFGISRDALMPAHYAMALLEELEAREAKERAPSSFDDQAADLCRLAGVEEIVEAHPAHAAIVGALEGAREAGGLNGADALAEAAREMSEDVSRVPVDVYPEVRSARARLDAARAAYVGAKGKA